MGGQARAKVSIASFSVPSYRMNVERIDNDDRLTPPHLELHSTDTRCALKRRYINRLLSGGEKLQKIY